MDLRIIEKELTLITEILGQLEKKLENAPEGKLRIRRHRHGYQYRLYKRAGSTEPRKEKYVSKRDQKTLKVYATKRYYNKLKAVLERERACLDSMSRNYNPSQKYLVYSEMPAELRALVKPAVLPVSESNIIWRDGKYKTNSYPMSSESSYTTRRKETVRSRAECITADVLDEMGLLYHYEEELKLDRTTHIYPDFTIAHPTTGERYYLELFGMMGDVQYATSAFQRIQQYALAGLASKIICIFDYPGVPFSTEALRHTLTDIFLEF